MSKQLLKRNRWTLILLLLFIFFFTYFHQFLRSLSRTVCSDESVQVPEKVQCNTLETFKVELYKKNFEMIGHIFFDKDPPEKISQMSTVSAIYNTSQYMRSQVRPRFLDIPPQMAIGFMSSSMILDDDKILFILRLKIIHNTSHIVGEKTNFIYQQRFNCEMEPAEYPLIKAIPYPGDMQLNNFNLLVLHVEEDIIISFNHKWHETRRPALYNVKSQTVSRLFFGAQDEEFLSGIQKNWAPFVYNGILYHIQYFDPMRIVRCELNGSCSIVFRMSNHTFDKYGLHIRGGTPFLPYADNYYIGVVHSLVFFADNPHYRHYTNHIMIMYMPDFRVVYLSDDLVIPDGIYHTTPIIVHHQREHVIYPTGLLLENSDSIILSGHVDDEICVFLRITGIQKSISEVISLDQSHLTKKGPPANYLQNFLYSRLKDHELYIHSTKFAQ